MGSTSTYSVPVEAEAVFRQEILGNPLMAHLPPRVRDLAAHVRFEGSARPKIMFNWRWTESISALKALEASMLNYLVTQKYGIDPVEVTINT